MSINNTKFLAFEVNKKSSFMAYMLLIFLGWFGVHNFYLGRSTVATIELLASMVGILLLFIISPMLNGVETSGALGALGLFLWSINWMMCLFDLFSLWHFVKVQNNKLAYNLDTNTGLQNLS